MQAQIESARDLMGGLYRSTLSYKGSNVQGTRSDWARDLDAEAEGLLGVETCEWTGLYGGFATVPTVNNEVTIDGVKVHVSGRPSLDQSGVIVLALRRREVLS